MDLIPSAEEAQLQDTMRRFAQDRASMVEADAAAYDESWLAFAALGGAGMAIAEDRGGFGTSLEGVALAAIELGAMPLPLPRVEQVVMVARLLEAADGETAAQLRDRFVAGDAQVALADWEGVGQHGFGALGTAAGRGGDALALEGAKAAVIGGAGAATLLVTALHEGAPALFAIDRADPGCVVREHRLADGTPVADLDLRRAIALGGAPLLGGNAFGCALDRARDEAIVVLCAAASGSMAAAIRLAVDYLKIRQQFGAPLSNFQALQQRVADLYIVANEARSSVYAAIAACHEHADARARAVSACKVKVGKAARHVTGEAIHLHGGIGFTTEYAVGHHHRRALVDSKLFGDRELHLSRYLDLGAPPVGERAARAGAPVNSMLVAAAAAH